MGNNPDRVKALAIKNKLDPSELPSDSKKHLCWTLYILEGKETRDIAGITGLSERQVQRHIKEWKLNLETNPEVMQEIAGELQAKIGAIFAEFYQEYKKAPTNIKPQWAGILARLLQMQWEKAVPDSIRQALVTVNIEGKTDEGREVTPQCEKCKTFHKPDEECRLIDKDQDKR